jgi:hypothetical protein
MARLNREIDMGCYPKGSDRRLAIGCKKTFRSRIPAISRKCALIKRVKP